MTGYGRSEQIVDGRAVTVEIKSVNHRYFEFSCRTTRGYSFLEEKLRLPPQAVLDLGQKRQIHRSSGEKYLLLFQPQHLAETFDDASVQFPGHLQAYRAELPAQFHHFRHMVSVVQILVINAVRVNIRIARHADQRLLYDPVFFENFRQKMQDQILCQHK